MEGRVLDGDDEQKYWAEFSMIKSQKFKTIAQKKNKGKGTTGFQRSGKRPASSNDSGIKAKKTVFKDEDETTNNHGENENAFTND